MITALSQLAKRGEIDRLSLQFSQFIDSQSAEQSSPLVLAVAALLSETALQGNVCVKLSGLNDNGWFTDLLRSEAPQLPAQDHDADYYRQQLLRSPMVGTAPEKLPLVIDKDRIYLYRYWMYEQSITSQIERRCQMAITLNEEKLNRKLAELFPGEDDSDQKNAADKAARYSFSVISGGPGTGKTTTVVKILSSLLALQPQTRVALAAPTGKAAARMMTSMQRSLQQVAAGSFQFPEEAFTIHRLLGYRRGKFEYHHERPLPFDCIVIDEASMIDIALMYRLLDACEVDCRIILLGDRDQLASVAAGNVLGDITGHGLPLSENTTPLKESIGLLQHSRRFAKNSGIAMLANLINRGASENTVALLKEPGDEVRGIFNDSEQPPASLLEQIIERYTAVVQAESPQQGLDRFDQFRVLSATNHGPGGVNELNDQINDRLRRNSKISNAGLYQGQAIMVTRNNRETRLYNGDVGIIWQLEGLWVACFRGQQDEIRQIAINRLPTFTTAWASTVHKCQGSEFDDVLLFLPADIEPRLLCREMLYTAVTRSTGGFTLYSTEEAVRQAVKRVTSRSSGLALRLGWPDPG